MLNWRGLGTTKIKKVVNFMSHFGLKKIISLKRSLFIKLDALQLFKNINKIRTRQKNHSVIEL